MSFYSLGEPECKANSWYNDTIDGLLKEKRQKRFMLTILDSVDELEHHSITDEDVIFVIGTSSNWLTKVIHICESYFDNRVIVLSDHESRLSLGKYSIVTTNIANDIQIFHNYLVSYNKTRIAMYGINPNSSSDIFRKESFLACGACEEDLFYNCGSLSECFKHFSQRMNEYDAVICVNDYSAISLVRLLNEHRQLYIVSCGSGTLLTHFFSPSITHTQIDYQMFAKAGLDLCRILQRNRDVTSININLSSKFSVGETTENMPLVVKDNSETTIIQKVSNNNYSDSEIEEMLKVETLLNSCDDNDFLMLDLLLTNMTYSEIADKLFMSTNGVKYRLRNMFKICQVSSKNEFIALLNRYKKK